MKKTVLVFLFAGLTLNSYSQPVWYEQISGTTNNLNNIFINYTQTGQILYIAGDNGIILRSSNNGLLWETVNSNTNSDLYSITIYQDTGFAVGSNGTVIRTTDSGNSWNVIPVGTSNKLKDVRMNHSNPAKVLIVGENGTFLKLVNETWVLAQIDTADLNSITYNSINVNQMWAAGNSGTILKSTNYGDVWTRMNSNTANNLNYISRNNYVVLGNNGTLLQINGSNVNVLNSGTQNDLFSLDDILNFTICGANGTLLFNSQPLNLNTSVNLYSVVTPNTDYCFTAGSNGKIYFTNNINISPKAKLLNSNNVSTWYMNNGISNLKPNSGGSGFEWPKGESKFARYSSGTLIGAIVNGDTLVTVCDYTSEYFPGYTDNGGIPNGNGNPDYRIYKMTFTVNDSDRIRWPNILLGNSDQGAPVYFDSELLSYFAADYGNQTMFYSYTDSYTASHTNYAGMTAPLKADIKQINFSFNQPEELKNIVYQEFRIINRSTSVWNNAYINLYSDDDLGQSNDDAEGVDTNFRLSYTYNFDNDDGFYGLNPPAVGYAVIRAPLIYTGNSNDTVFYCKGKRKIIKTGYKESKLNSTVIYYDDSYQPENYRESYNVIRGLKNDGTQYINPVTNQPTKFVNSGDPVNNTGWVSTYSGDMRFYQGFGPMNINPGDTQVIVIAQVIARGSSNINSITKLRETSVSANQFYDNCFENVMVGISSDPQIIHADFQLSQNYPNPFNPVTKINYVIPSNVKVKSLNVKLVVYDNLGKEVKTLVNEIQNAGNYSAEFRGENFPSGVYFYKLSYGNFSEIKKMILIK